MVGMDDEGENRRTSHRRDRKSCSKAGSSRRPCRGASPQASVAHVQEAGTVEAQDLSAVLGDDDPWAAILEISEENV